MNNRSLSTLTNRKVLVTGGAGFIGSHLIDELTKHKARVKVVADNLYLGSYRNLEKAQKSGLVEIVKANVADYKKLGAIITHNKIDTVFHLATVPLPASLVKPAWSFNQNIAMAQNLCELARLKKYQFLINFSSSEVYGTAQYNPIDELHPMLGHTPYAASKLASDALVWSYVQTFGIKALIIRPFNNFGPRQNYGKFAGIIPLTIKNIMSGHIPQLSGDGSQTRDFVYVKDTVRITLALVRKVEFNGEVYNIATGKEISMKQVVEKICNLMKYKKGINFTQSRPGDVQKLIGSSTKLRKVIKPKFSSFDDSLKETVNWYKRNIV